MSVQTKRAYDVEDKDKGYRVLVDRLWPRGVSKDDLGLDEWRKDLAPSDELRKWFGHDPERWSEFKKRYKKELSDKKDDIEHLRKKAKRRKVLLLFGAKDEEHNQAVVLRDMIAKGL